MASSCTMNTTTTNKLMLLLLIMTIFSSHQCFFVSSFEYQVGGNNGWVVPPANDSRIYNDWASENRFRVGDTVHFKYRKDSVMEVAEEDYKKCNASHPRFFSNTGNTVYKLNHSGPFYFISGVSGHCEKGQRMIIKVMSLEDDSSDHKKSSASTSVVSKVVLSHLLVLSYVASCVFY